MLFVEIINMVILKVRLEVRSSATKKFPLNPPGNGGVNSLQCANAGASIR